MTDTRLGRILWRVADELDYLLTLARLRILDALAGPEPETPADQQASASGWKVRDKPLGGYATWDDDHEGPFCRACPVPARERIPSARPCAVVAPRAALHSNPDPWDTGSWSWLPSSARPRISGWREHCEYRWAEGRYDRLPALASDLVGRKVEVIVTGGPAVLAAKDATSMIPIIVFGGDPVRGGLLASLARPGGNLTGFSILAPELMPKRLELLSELVPQAGVIALLVNPTNPTADRIIRDVQEAARTKGVQLAS
jgi:hypothetical protein